MALWDTLRKGPLKVVVLGGGNWGSVVARIAATNSASSYLLDNDVTMWMKEEIYNGRPLTEVINETRENPRYLPGFKFPENVTVTSDLKFAANKADLIIIVIPHQFLRGLLKELKGNNKPSAQAISLVKGIEINDQGLPALFSQIISTELGIPCCAMSGANVASDIAKQQFSESTLGYSYNDRDVATIWQQVFETPYFRIQGVPDLAGVQVCGAVKNVVAVAAGFSDGMALGTNTKAALIRIGVDEMRRFASCFFEGVLEETFLESAGYADVITTCFGGRNVRCAAEFVRRKGKASWETIENDLLKGQKMQGQLTAAEVYAVLKANQLCQHFPLFTTVYQIAYENLDASHLIQRLSTKAKGPNTLKSFMDCKTIPKVEMPTYTF